MVQGTLKRWMNGDKHKALVFLRLIRNNKKHIYIIHIRTKVSLPHHTGIATTCPKDSLRIQKWESGSLSALNPCFHPYGIATNRSDSTADSSQPKRSMDCAGLFFHQNQEQNRWMYYFCCLSKKGNIFDRVLLMDKMLVVQGKVLNFTWEGSRAPCYQIYKTPINTFSC